MSKLSEMLACITGSTKGLGYAIAKALAQEGYHIILHGRDETELNIVRTELLALHNNLQVFCYAADFSRKQEVISFAAKILANHKTIDVLVNNAGVFLSGNLMQEEDAIFEYQMQTNVYSAYYLTKALYPAIKSSKQASIFNMCSIASLGPYPNGSSYCISKFALLGFSKCLREELKQENIKVTSILPGAAWSNSWKGADLPYDRLMEANDIAIAVVAALKMSPSAVMEEIILRPQLGDL